MYYNYFPYQNNTRLWLPILAGAAIIAAPFWLNGRNNCCGNQPYYQTYQQPYPYQYQYQYQYQYPQSYLYPQPYPYPINIYN